MVVFNPSVSTFVIDNSILVQNTSVYREYSQQDDLPWKIYPSNEKRALEKGARFL